MIRNEISEYPYQGIVKRNISGKGDDDDAVVEIYNGVMEETMQTDDEGRLLQTSSYVISMPLTQDSDGNYIIPRKGDTVELVRYGETILFTVDNAEPSQLMGISVYCTRNKWK